MWHAAIKIEDRGIGDAHLFLEAEEEEKRNATKEGNKQNKQKSKQTNAKQIAMFTYSRSCRGEQAEEGEERNVKSKILPRLHFQQQNIYAEYIHLQNSIFNLFGESMHN